MATSLESLTECSICTHIFREPVSLSCDHNFCKSCVRKLTKNNKVVCPVCKKVTGEQTVKPDFRLAQFLDALAEQAKQLTTSKEDVKSESNTTKFAVKVKSDITNCDLCSTFNISHLCEDCRRWLCENCAGGHLKIPFCTNHKIISLEQKNKEVTLNLSEELGGLDKDITEHQKLISTAKSNIMHAKELKDKLLTKSNELMQEITDFFEKIKDNVSSNVQHNIDENEREKAQINKQLESLISNRKIVTKILEESSSELAIHGSPILDETKLRRSQSDTSKFQLTSADITLDKTKEFDIRKSVTLDYKSNGLITIAQKDWNMVKSFEIKSAVRASRVIGDCLYCCCDDGIRIFDRNLDLLREIHNDGLTEVYDIAELPSGDVVLASRQGMFLLDLKTSKHQKIATGVFTSLQFHRGRIYVAELRTHTIRVCSRNNKWQIIAEHKLPCTLEGHVVCIYVDNDMLYANCGTCGHLWLVRTGKEKTDVRLIATLHDKPLLCKSDETGMLLVKTSLFEVAILDKFGEYHSKQFEKQPAAMMRWAVYWCGNIYINKLAFSNAPSSVIMYGAE